MSSGILIYFAIFMYLATGILLALRLFALSQDHRPPRPLALGLGGAGIILQAWVLLLGINTDTGINLSFFSAVSLAAWTMLTLLLVSSLTKPVENLGILLFPMGALALWLEHRYPGMHLLRQTATWGIKLHVVLSMLAYSLLALAAVQAILLAIQDHHLHTRHPGGFIRALPPLQTMESLLFEMIGAGFGFLTLSLASGFVFLEDMFAQHLVHKTVLAVAGWVVFGLLLVGRLRVGWRGRTAIVWTLGGFAVLMLAYFGSKAVLELILGRP